MREGGRAGGKATPTLSTIPGSQVAVGGKTNRKKKKERESALVEMSVAKKGFHGPRQRQAAPGVESEDGEEEVEENEGEDEEGDGCADEEVPWKKP